MTLQPRDLPEWRRELQGLDRRIKKLRKDWYQNPPFADLKKSYEEIRDELLNKVLRNCPVVSSAPLAIAVDDAEQRLRNHSLTERTVDSDLEYALKHLRLVLDTMPDQGPPPKS